MSALFGRQSVTCAIRWAALSVLALIFAGCGPPTAEKRLKEAFANNPQAKEVGVALFEGTVTVDGKPPATPRTQLLVILNDPKNPQDPSKRPKLLTGCDEQGHFSFSTYKAHDGVEVGSYVVTFVQLHNLGARMGMNRNVGYGPPDELKNLYNDPDKNASIPEFNVVIQKPGIPDARFDLIVAGKEPVETPGPHAITALNTR